MSILKVDTITDQSGKGKPNFPHGVNVTGALTINGAALGGGNPTGTVISYAGSSAPTGYTGFSNVEQSGKGKGAVAMTVTNAAKNYLVILKTDGYSEVSFVGTVDVP